jgi:fimbrial chaperone protein
VSPPIATIAPGATQTVRIVLRKPPQGREGTYRVLLDQIPPVASPGTVRIALRLSIQVFAAPATPADSKVAFRVENKAGQLFLVATNSGTRHETIRDVALKGSDGGGLTSDANSTPYILAGATRRWPIGGLDRMPATGDSVHLTGLMTSGAVDQRVAVVATP